MRIRKLYLANDGTQFPTREQAVRYERNIIYAANERNRYRRRQERQAERFRVATQKRQIKENELRDRLTRIFGETIAPAINTIIQNRTMIRKVLTTRA